MYHVSIRTQTDKDKALIRGLELEGQKNKGEHAILLAVQQIYGDDARFLSECEPDYFDNKCRFKGDISYLSDEGLTGIAIPATVEIKLMTAIMQLIIQGQEVLNKPIKLEVLNKPIKLSRKPKP